VHGGALAQIQHTALNRAGVGGVGHLGPQGTELAHDLPLLLPPMEGLQGMLPTLSMFTVNTAVRQPRRAAARAASMPAWPAPTTMMS